MVDDAKATSVGLGYLPGQANARVINQTAQWRAGQG